VATNNVSFHHYNFSYFLLYNVLYTHTDTPFQLIVAIEDVFMF